MAHLKLYFLGAPRIERDGGAVYVDTRKAIALLAYLAVTGGSHTRDSLAAMFWPEADGSRARAALRRTLSALKAALGGVGLDVERETLRIDPAPEWWIDTHEFQARLAGCDAPQPLPERAPENCLESLRAAAALYRGDFMQGFSLRDSLAFDDWQFFQAEGFRRKFAAALEKLAWGSGDKQDFETAIAYARSWVAIDPLREEAHRQLMQLYASSGQRNAALRQYRECIRILEQELGVSPLDETTLLYQAILENKGPGGRAQGDAGAGEHWSRGAWEPGGEGAQKRAPYLPASPAPGWPVPWLPSSLPLVGRSVETVAMLRAYERAASGGYFLALEGEPGIGKTRLAEEFLSYARAHGAATISGMSYEGETDLVYGPLIEALRAALKLPDHAARLQSIPPHWLAEAARLLPELAAMFPRMPPAPPLEGPGAQSRFQEGLTQVLQGLCARKPGAPPSVLFLDDLHWADAATLHLLAYMVRRLRQYPLLILGTWRKEGIASDHPLLSLILEVQRTGKGSVLPLSRLRSNHVADLIQASAAAGLATPPGLEARLHQEAEGLPFFIVEYLASLVEGANPMQGGDWAMPHSVRDLLRVRLAKVSDAGWQLLTTAAVIGRSFDFDGLRRASGRSEAEIVSGLEALIAQGLILENEAAPSYDFSHEKLRALVYEETSLARRRLLHRRVAEALIEGARHRPETGASAGQIARHFQLAGQEAEAVAYFKAAGEYARSLFANAEALAYFQAALACGSSKTADLYEVIGDLHTLLGEYGPALKNYETSASLCEPYALARVEHKLGELHHWRGAWDLAEIHYAAALETLEGQENSDERARLYADWARTAFQRNEHERALELAHQALALAERAGESRALAQAHNMLGILARNRQEFEAASRHLETSLASAGRLGDTSARVAALNNLALAYGDQGKLDQAISVAESALQLCTQQGDRHREAALHNNLADLLHRAGQSAGSMEHLKKAVAIFAEIGDVSPGLSQVSPEIWKLTEW